ncbi:hypothetical protein [Rhodovastum atsumiense]|uniref:Uncharacterized protein n=1 Tax=Rhodovastum atsumiense TaxID=504468 RepID=A0A5M6IK80_9PROT|nr:hypothetical protein [Rhodovastum atsumiense]KAA5608664.1 hypothetical protein F1189_28060 [Rhodovastum atsumiense]
MTVGILAHNDGHLLIDTIALVLAKSSLSELAATGWGEFKMIAVPDGRVLAMATGAGRVFDVVVPCAALSRFGVLSRVQAVIFSWPCTLLLRSILSRLLHRPGSCGSAGSSTMGERAMINLKIVR